MHFHCDTNDNILVQKITSIENENDNTTITRTTTPPSPPPSSSSNSSITSTDKMNDLLLTTTATASSNNENFRSTSNPECWTAEQVKSWLNWCSSEYALTDIPFEKFIMNGKALCMLNEDMFKKRVPNSGDILYQALQNLIPKVANYQLETFNNGKLLNNNNNYSRQDINMLDISTATANVNNKNLYTAQFNTNSDNEDDDDNNSLSNKNIKLIIDENSNNSEDNTSYKMQQPNKRKSAVPTAVVASSNSNSNNNRKRSANSRLENVIGNLKNRKLNHNNNTVATTVSISNNNNNDDYAASFSQPLSPSSTSSSISQSSCLSPSASPKQRTISVVQNPKQRWTNHSNNDTKLRIPTTVGHQDLMNLLHQAVVGNKQQQQQQHYHNDNGSAADSANCTASSPSSTRCDQDSDTLKEHMSTPVSSCASENGHNPTSPLNEYKNVIQQKSNGRGAAAASKAKQAQIKGGATATEKVKLNVEDPTRQIKFYDDYIDFRGDILRRPPSAKNCRILWEYLYLLLENKNYASIIRWEDSVQMVFRIVQAEKLAALWGLQKNRLGMTYEKLSRGMRYYYPNNIIAREPGRRLLYRFMRHPDDIKKTVKKNGTYMLKRAKLELKNAKSSDTTSATANANTNKKSNIKNNKNLEDDDIDCEEEDGVEEAGESEIIDDSEDINATATTDIIDDDDNDDVDNNNNNNNNNSDSGLDETPVTEIKKQKFNDSYKINHSSDNSKNNGNKIKIVKNNNSNQQQQQQQHQLTQRLVYPNLYPFLTAQMAAAFQQQQQQSGAATNGGFFPRATNNEEVLAAHFLMQLRNQNQNEQSNNNSNNNNNNNQLNFESVTNQLAAAAAAAAAASNSSAGQLNLQQMFSNQDAFVALGSGGGGGGARAKLPTKIVDQLPHSKSSKAQHELPLNLCVNSKKRKMNANSIIKKEQQRTSDDENQENDRDNKNKIEEIDKINE